ncbi:MAG: ANTAR domain-containing protein [Spirochaetes bacterium]|uniref:ANTAR domain-containing protein n=1 Tax=Candidatus Ornithospirochaeta stercoripullorum TaxID=2840899 RepID=A0A9D9DYI1_9SPIO|nr:ANTAR domain-containing protein [Candidatus Ornithospirochaeta stercoripullorum]
METVLVVAERSACDEIKRMLALGSYTLIRAENAKEARMKILDISFSLVIVVSPLPAGSAKEVALFASGEGVDTILIVPDSFVGNMAEVMGKYGIYVSSNSREGFASVLRSVRVAREKVHKAEEKNRKLLERLKNEKLLTEAKCLLAKNKAMSEQEAHAYIEKKAMNNRISLSDAAMSIVSELS